jgi:phosphoserine phosphatase RsbU/P
MTMCFATWQRGRQKLRIANAGQSQPLLYKDGRCEKLDLSGFPLGLYNDASYDEIGFTLVSGDILVFHSDGLAESMNADGQFFGTDKLREVIEANHSRTANEIADRLLEEVELFTGRAPLADDRTLVVAKVN